MFLAFVALLAVVVVGLLARKARPRRVAAPLSFMPPRTRQSDDWLSRVSCADFTRKPILNAGERAVLEVVDEVLKNARPAFRACPQVSLGEVLQSPDQEAYRAINSKRADVLIVNEAGLGILAIEYQGAGHYQRNAPARDAIKKEALRRAGIPTIEIGHGDKRPDVQTKILLGLNPILDLPTGNRR
ncbi:MAG: DUF2726 domain-containing protein [Acidiphilium sp.]|nr:DUF2726 domain-containing protein [Acidiphilium sp.]